MIKVPDAERQKILDRLEKLMEHTDTSNGDRTFNANEMAIAQKLMKELMEKYDISINEIQQTQDRTTLVKEFMFDVTGRNPRIWIQHLANILGKFYDCRVVRGGAKFYFVGFEMDAAVASKMFEKLYVQIYYAALDATKGDTGRARATRTNEFSNGAVMALSGRLRQIKDETFKHTTALVVVKKETVNEAFKKLHPYTTSSRNTSNVSHSDDFYNGVVYGQQVEIHKSMERNE